jgi:diguanylate cyclase
MTATAHRFLRFFGSVAGHHGESAATAAARASDRTPAPGPALSAVDRANHRLIGEIAEFLTSCRLAVTSHNLLIAHAAFSGEDPHLARSIGQRRLAGEAITQDWLDSQVKPDDHESAIRTMTAQLEDSLDRFAHTAHTARASTADCNAALARQVDRAVQMPESVQFDDVLGLAHTILDHSRKLESDIRSSEQETRHLRERLARAQRDADIDHLTGLPNRRAFEALYRRQYREAQTAIDSLCIAICDIDHFKLVNDRHGHETGDRVIREVAETLDRLSNQTCHVARHGGEEFVLLFRGLNKAQACAKLDAVREAFAARRFVNRKTDDPIGQVTFSGGVADVFAYANPREALRAADAALYAAKEQGRNAVLAAP